MSETSMFGAFDLKPGVDDQEFLGAFHAFCLNLQSEGYVQAWKTWIRTPHQGYDNRPPDVRVLVEIEFATAERAQSCYDYVALRTEPLDNIHRKMNGLVNDTHFALYRRV